MRPAGRERPGALDGSLVAIQPGQLSLEALEERQIGRVLDDQGRQDRQSALQPSAQGRNVSWSRHR